MLAQGYGVIVNVVALEGEHPVEGQVVASTIAGGVAALTRALAVEWAGAGVRVVGISPGRHQGSGDEAPGAPGPALNEDLDAYRRRTPLGRLAAPSEIGQAVLFLVGSTASFITGEILPVDGGWRAYQLF
jgi:NAD(P)-dependent dehydrogenase (short-subunit alcohol dehydrogenase family)